MPLVTAKMTPVDKVRYLQSLFDTIYISDIMDMYNLSYEKSVLDAILNIVSSSVGSLTNANKVSDEEKRKQEINSLKRVGDSFKKIVVVKDNILPWHDDNGILYVGIEQFLLDESATDI